jgi:hypothetical protein
MVSIQGKAVSKTVSLADLYSFSFHKNPLLVVENFGSPDERQFFRGGVRQAAWKSLRDLPKVREYFQNAGNRAKAEIGQAVLRCSRCHASTASVGWVKSQVISDDSQLPDGS